MLKKGQIEEIVSALRETLGEVLDSCRTLWPKPRRSSRHTWGNTFLCSFSESWQGNGRACSSSSGLSVHGMWATAWGLQISCLPVIWGRFIASLGLKNLLRLGSLKLSGATNSYFGKCHCPLFTGVSIPCRRKYLKTHHFLLLKPHSPSFFIRSPKLIIFYSISQIHHFLFDHQNPSILGVILLPKTANPIIKPSPEGS